MKYSKGIKMPSVTQIVITGGPCGGKTSCLSTLFERLTAKGYKVITISETATDMFMSGIKNTEILPPEFEKMVIEYQIAKEKIALKAALNFPKVVILYDRGIPDCRAYMSDLDYQQGLKENDLNEFQALNRYDAVMHLLTAAKGAEQFYTCENNQARNEMDLEAIRQIDDKTQQAYANHPHLYIIDNSTDFEGKINRLCAKVFSVLGLSSSVF
ncbi:MAG: hypothetical protein E7013_04290 [Alphaproteobacteria bacterium]|nr:hypothetical protein [Alphaproteobacteria bacterium]